MNLVNVVAICLFVQYIFVALLRIRTLYELRLRWLDAVYERVNTLPYDHERNMGLYNAGAGDLAMLVFNPFCWHKRTLKSIIPKNAFEEVFGCRKRRKRTSP